MSWLYVGLLSIPFLSIISRVIYVQSNKNAYQSYSGTQEIIQQNGYEYKTNDLNNIDDLIVNNIYLIDLNEITWAEIDFEIYFNKVWIFNVNNTLILNSDIEDYISYNDKTFEIEINDNNGNYFYYYPTGDELIYFTYSYISSYSNDFLISDFLTQSNFFGNALYVKENISLLDNVFAYSVNEIIKENNFGNIDFFLWFTDMFLTDNQVNNMYVGFANWYFNYVLMASCGYLLFLVLMWFINYSRRLLERGMNYDW